MTGARMSRSAQVNMFVAAVVGLAAAVVVLTLVLPARDLEWSWWGALILLIAARVAEAGIVEITRNSDEAGYGISLATVPQIVCALLLPAPIACLVAGASMLLDEYNHRSPAARLAFNVSSTMLSVGVAGIATNVLGISGAGLGIVGWTAVASLLGVAGSYYLANALPVACGGAIAGGRPILPALVHSVRANALSEVAFALLGGLAAFVWVINPYWLLVGIVPAVISQLALRYVAERNRQAAQLASLDRLGQQLSASPTADGIFEAIRSEMRTVRAVDGCFLSLIGSGAHFADGLASDEAEHALCRQLAAKELWEIAGLNWRSQTETAVAEESETERSVTADAVQTVVRDIGDFADAVGAQVGKFRGFEVAPDVFDWIDVRRIARQRLDAQPIALAGDPLQHVSAAMRGQSVPDQQHPTVLDVVHIRQELNERFVVVGARTQFEDQVCITAIRFVHQGTGQRQPLPAEPMAQHRGVAPGCPGRTYRRQ